MIKEITIKNVEVVKGSTIDSNWSLPMQVIETEDGDKYIENTHYHRSSHWIPVDYKDLIGKTIEIQVVNNGGHEWSKLTKKGQEVLEDVLYEKYINT